MDRRVKPGDDRSGWVNLIETCANARSRDAGAADPTATARALPVLD
jgi:hypothetical protein